MTALPPLPDFVSYSAAIPNPAAAQAVASSLPPDAAADPSNEGGLQGAPAGIASKPCAAGVTDRLGSNISDVGELFHFARMLCAQARIHPGTISPAAVAVAEEIRDYEDAYYDPPPLFLRAGGWR